MPPKRSPNNSSPPPSSHSSKLENFVKFPHTAHLFSAGGTGVSRDDLLFDDRDAQAFFRSRISCEEKVDGANIGFSLQDGRIAVQNRSHFVTSESHPQFSQLGEWTEAHRNELLALLSTNCILFGEWLYARHSVLYERLPDLFLAFDVYDLTAGNFLSRNERNRRLSALAPSINVVPLLAEGVFSRADLTTMLMTTNSQFADGPLEGIYMRIDDEATGLLVNRSKIVRPDFIQHIEEVGQWTRTKLVKNRLSWY